MSVKATHLIIVASALALPLRAQELGNEEKTQTISDEVQKAIDEFNRLKKEGREKANEVTVVFPPQK